MAVANWESSGCLSNGDVASINCIVPLFQNIVSAVVAFAGIGLLVMLFVGGFNFLFSAGDPKKLEAARGTITNAIIGLVIIVVAYLILVTIEAFTGVSVTKFEFHF